ncbi:hypothetical protein TTHERM_000182193 (macronuclear) [Tetrahymena thermophila SB210]|uniref:Transmembrane protein n=1 Tax=Tetrahymena thermophila (strain SB210) TaxID=312017 RepID=W7XLG0_TETTS|nr:hypothetical protein TTHERM_000182193 [Tetrahymena thermophila SB210]EWS76224.1 hypothetical protein TTHERM_000182193 [Tetrahymena thermophila SB210]|eukprot:XP_012651271.1 hypothetical protein TTHERM_000182193 [Tetrahymena thermophila SB210]
MFSKHNSLIILFNFGQLLKLFLFQNINLRQNKLNDVGVSKLGEALFNCNNLSSLTLNISDNNICQQGATELGNSLGKSNNLIKLNLNIQYFIQNLYFIVKNHIFK